MGLSTKCGMIIQSAEKIWYILKRCNFSNFQSSNILKTWHEGKCIWEFESCHNIRFANSRNKHQQMDIRKNCINYMWPVEKNFVTDTAVLVQKMFIRNSLRRNTSEILSSYWSITFLNDLNVLRIHAERGWLLPNPQAVETIFFQVFWEHTVCYLGRNFRIICQAF